MPEPVKFSSNDTSEFAQKLQALSQLKQRPSSYDSCFLLTVPCSANAVTHWQLHVPSLDH